MSNVVMTIHTFDNSYAGFPASEIQTCSCHGIFRPGHSPARLLISEVGNRHLRGFSAKRHREMCEQAVEICGGQEAIVVDLRGHGSTRTFVHKRDNSNLNFNEVSL